MEKPGIRKLIDQLTEGMVVGDYATIPTEVIGIKLRITCVAPGEYVYAELRVGVTAPIDRESCERKLAFFGFDHNSIIREHVEPSQEVTLTEA